ncbi:MAG: hypothetical protein LCH39_05075 [Proteobacteria bacterium]|nr:hypothetical protein [Pseudomonadota bacterium]
MSLYPALLLFLMTPALAQPRAAEPDALAGHAAEARQWAGEQDPFRRALFLDPVEVETAVTGLDCAHRKARKPEAVLGAGHVVLRESIESTPRRLRLFSPPGGGTLEEARERAEILAKRQWPGVKTVELAARTFDWCR